MINYVYKLPDLAGGWNYFCLENGLIVTRNDEGEVIGTKEPDLLVEGEIIENKLIKSIADTFVVLKDNQGNIEVRSKQELNEVMRKSLENDNIMLKGLIFNSKPQPTPKAPTGKMGFLGKIFGDKPKVDNPADGGWANKPHKYLDKRADPKNPNKWIYLYELPSGKRQWRNQDGAEHTTTPTHTEQELQNMIPKEVRGLKKDDSVMYNGEFCTVANRGEKFITIKSAKGGIKAINVTDYNATKNLKKVGQDDLARHKPKSQEEVKENTNQTIKTVLSGAVGTDQYKMQMNPNFKEQDNYGYFKNGATDGYSNVNDIRQEKVVNNNLNSFKLARTYDPETEIITISVNGDEDFKINGKDVYDIHESGFILHNGDNSQEFLSFEDYNKDKAENERKDGFVNDNETFSFNAKTGETSVRAREEEGTALANQQFQSEVIKRELARRESQAKQPRTRTATSKQTNKEPIQSEEEKAKIRAEQIEANKKQQADIQQIKGTQEYKDYSGTMQDRGFQASQDPFIFTKKTKVAGRDFKITAEFNIADNTIASKVEGKYNKLKLAGKEHEIMDISDSEVFYNDNGTEKAISIADLETINGKQIFEPTAESKGIISNFAPTKIYFSPDGKNTVLGQYEIIDAKDLVTSHFANGESNPDYTISEAQNRDRTTLQSKNQINNISINPMFELLASGNTADKGTPIVNENYEAIAGNGRGMGLLKHYEGNTGKYKNDLIENAKQYGFDPEEIKGMDKPVLVRRVNIDNKEAQRLGSLSNESTMLAQEGREEAKGKATRIDDNTFNKISGLFQNAKGDNSSISEYLDEVGGDIIKELFKQNVIPDSEKHLYTNLETGKLDASHKDKVKELLTQSILGNSSSHFEKIPDKARQGITKAMGTIFALKGKDGDLTEPIQGAVKILASYNAVKDNFGSPLEFVQQEQNNAFEPLQAHPKTLAMFELLAGKTENQIKNDISEYKNLMEGDMFSEGKSSEEAFKEVFKPRGEATTKQNPQQEVKAQAQAPKEEVSSLTPQTYTEYESEKADAEKENIKSAKELATLKNRIANGEVENEYLGSANERVDMLERSINLNHSFIALANKKMAELNKSIFSRLFKSKKSAR